MKLLFSIIANYYYFTFEVVLAEVGSSSLHVTAAVFSVVVAALRFWQCSGSARYIFK